MDMDDRSEKIVTLARAMLQRPEVATPPAAYSLKTIALVALLSAASAGGLVGLETAYARPLNHYEKTELRALIWYAAKTRSLDGHLIEEDFYHKFALQSFDDLSAGQMHEARAFLHNYIH